MFPFDVEGIISLAFRILLMVTVDPCRQIDILKKESQDGIYVASWLI